MIRAILISKTDEFFLAVLNSKLIEINKNGHELVDVKFTTNFHEGDFVCSALILYKPKENI